MQSSVKKSAGSAGEDQSTTALLLKDLLESDDLLSESDGKIVDDNPGESAEAVAAAIPEPHVSERQTVASTDRNNATVVAWNATEAPVLDIITAEIESSVAPDQAGGVLGSVPAVENSNPPPLHVYRFYMVRVPKPIVPQEIKTDISYAEQQLHDKTHARNAQNYVIQAARGKRNEAHEKLKAAREVERDLLSRVQEKWKVINPLRDHMKRLKEVGRTLHETSSGDIPKSEEDLNHKIAALEWRIQHDSIPLKEEKQLVRDIKALESSRRTVRAKDLQFAQVIKSQAQHEKLEDTLKPLDEEYKQLDAELKKAIQVTDTLNEEYKHMNAALKAVYEKLDLANVERQEAYVHLNSLRRQEKFRKKDFYNNKNNIQEAKLMANKPNNSKAVEEYCNSQVERRLEAWNTDDEYRKNYVKDNEVSYLRRFGTLDGRSLGPDEVRPILPDHNRTGPASSRRPGSPQIIANMPARVEKVDAVSNEAASASSPVVEENRAEKREVANEASVSMPVEETKAALWADRKERKKEKKALKKAEAVAAFTESESLSGRAPGAESIGRVAESEEVVSKEVMEVMSSSECKRGGTNARQQVIKAAAKRAGAWMLPVRAKLQKVLGLPLQSVVGAGVGMVLLAVLFFFLI